MTRVLVLNGPNLGRLGVRQPEIYGATTHEDLSSHLRDTGTALGLDVEVRQTNHEGEMLDWLGEAADGAIAVVLNPAGWSHTSVALADAVAQVDLVVEVHISNVHAREEFRKNLLVSPYATGVITGLGLGGYDLALTHIAAVSDLVSDPAKD